jgi:hypothetical protein
MLHLPICGSLCSWFDPSQFRRKGGRGGPGSAGSRRHPCNTIRPTSRCRLRVMGDRVSSRPGSSGGTLATVPTPLAGTRVASARGRDELQRASNSTRRNLGSKALQTRCVDPVANECNPIRRFSGLCRGRWMKAGTAPISSPQTRSGNVRTLTDAAVA